MGAPRKHPPANAAAEIERLAASGFAVIGIAKNLGVSRETLKRWMDENESLQEAFEIGREHERQALHALIVQSAVLNKPANVNAFFILKARHGYRENDSPNTNVSVAVAVAPVMVVTDHGTDEQWAEKVAAQQRRLAMDATTPRQLEASQVASQEPSTHLPYVDAVPAYAPPGWVPTQPQQTAPAPPAYGAPVWKQNA